MTDAAPQTTPTDRAAFLTGDGVIDQAIGHILHRCAPRLPVGRLDPEFVRRVAAREFVAEYRRFNRTVSPPSGMPRATPPAEGGIDDADVRSLGFDLRVLDPGSGSAHAGRADADERWAAVSDDQVHPAGLAYLQFSRGDRCVSEDSAERIGDAVGLSAGVLNALGHDVPAVAAVSTAHAGPLVKALARLLAARRAPLTLILTQGPPSSWARDHALAMRGADGGPRVLLPSAASRADLPGEASDADDAAVAALAAVIPVRRSRLAFQGGNIVICHGVATDAGARERVALIGEAEIARNAGLGDAAAVLRAFADELSVDRVVSLPNASFHIDFDLLALPAERDGRPARIGLPDERTAGVLLVREAIGRLGKAGMVERRLERTIGELLARSSFEAFAESMWSWLAMVRRPSGPIVPEVASAFADRETAIADPARRAWQGLADTHRFLAAVDRLIAGSDRAWLGKLNEPHRTYYLCLARLADARDQVRTQVRKAGLPDVSVVSAPDADFGVGVINAAPLGGCMTLPNVRGIGSGVVSAGLANIRQALRKQRVDGTQGQSPGSQDVGVLAIDPGLIDADESFFRQGAVRCSLIQWQA